MRNIISAVVKSLADYIEFEEAVALGTQRGALNELLMPNVRDEGKLAMVHAQSDLLWERVMRAGNNSHRIGEGEEFHQANAEITRRKNERKRTIKARQAERDEARSMKEMLAAF